MQLAHNIYTLKGHVLPFHFSPEEPGHLHYENLIVHIVLPNIYGFILAGIVQSPSQFGEDLDFP